MSLSSRVHYLTKPMTSSPVVSFFVLDGKWMLMSVPPAAWTFATPKKNGYKFPQTIAHRGYKAQHPENTMGAFVGAVKAGSHAIETDIHLSKDDVVVLSHVRQYNAYQDIPR